MTADHGMLVVPMEHMGLMETVPSELRPWDIIIKSGESEVGGMSDFVLVEDQEEIDLIVLRDGKQVSVTLPLLDMPEPRVYRPSDEDEADSTNSPPRGAIKKWAYYQEGEDVWGTHTLLEEGNALIDGKLIISGKPVEGVNVSLFLAGNNRTQPATTDQDGRFEISVPPGKYFYIGYALYGPGAPDRKMISVDKNLAPFGSSGIDNYPLDLRTLSKDSVPDIVYNEPIKIVAPLHNTKVSLNRLTFAWVPYQGADSYLVKIAHIVREGTTTRNIPVCEKTTHGNSLDASKLECKEFGFMDDDKIDDLVSGERYGLRVFAYDKAGKLLTASSQHRSVEFFVK